VESRHQAFSVQSKFCTHALPAGAIGTAVGVGAAVGAETGVGAGAGVGLLVAPRSVTRTSAQFLNCSPHFEGPRCEAGHAPLNEQAPPHHLPASHPCLSISWK